MATKPRPQSAPETREEAALRWRRYGRYALLAAGGLALIYLAWAYLWPMIHPRMLPVELPPEVSIEEVVADYRDDGTAADKKYGGKRIVVVGRLVVEPPKGGKPALIFYQLPGENEEEARVPVEFFDIDDATTVDPGDQVSLSGVIKPGAAGKLRLVGAGKMPTPE
jgi:hypothetical protein